jgi:hypothetical protein
VTREDAVKAINELVRAEVAIVKQVNSGQGRVSKASEKRERLAVTNLFEALTGGEVASDAEVQEMIGV